MKINAQRFNNIELSLIIKSKSFSDDYISRLIGFEASLTKTDNKEFIWQFKEKNISRSLPYSEDFEIDMFIYNYLQQKEKVWELLKEKANISLIISSNEAFDSNSYEDKISYNSGIEISSTIMSELSKRNINLKINQSFLINLNDFTS